MYRKEYDLQVRQERFKPPCVSALTHLRRPVEAGDHSVFGPALICKLSVQNQLCTGLQVTETAQRKKKLILINRVYPSSTFTRFVFSCLFFSMCLTPPYPLDLCRCSQSRRPHARPEPSPQICCLARKMIRTPRCAWAAASALLSALWECLYTENSMGGGSCLLVSHCGLLARVICNHRLHPYPCPALHSAHLSPPGFPLLVGEQLSPHPLPHLEHTDLFFI